MSDRNRGYRSRFDDPYPRNASASRSYDSRSQDRDRAGGNSRYDYQSQRSRSPGMYGDIDEKIFCINVSSCFWKSCSSLAKSKCHSLQGRSSRLKRAGAQGGTIFSNNFLWLFWAIWESDP